MLERSSKDVGLLLQRRDNEVILQFDAGPVDRAVTARILRQSCSCVNRRVSQVDPHALRCVAL